MYKTVPATVRNGRIELLEQTELNEGSRLLVTLLSDEERDFWLRASETAIDQIWDNPADDIDTVMRDPRPC